MKEIKFLKTFNHINIIIWNNRNINELLYNNEICRKWIIFIYSRKQSFRWRNSILLFYLNNIFKKLQKRIVHRDLKPQNVLLTNNNETIKIKVFVLSKKNKKNELLKLQVLVIQRIKWY